MCEKVLTKNPNDIRVWLNKGQILLAQRRRQKALQAFERALQLDPLNFQAWKGKGYVLYSLGQKKAYSKAGKGGG